jgi:hypothetical protein
MIYGYSIDYSSCAGSNPFMKYRFSLHRLQAQIVLIVLASMPMMLIFHCVMIINYTAANNRHRLDYIKTANKNAAMSLNAIG